MIPLLTALAWADQPAPELPRCAVPTDETAVYVLTVQPMDDIINLFGHTALVFWNPEKKSHSPMFDYGRFVLSGSFVDIAVNYLTMQQEYFVGSNALGRSLFRWDKQSRGVIAQRLDLTETEARKLELVIQQQTETNPTFRYNWYDANCSTKIRDRIDEATEGVIRAAMTGPSGTSPAAEVLRHSGDHPLWLGLEWGSTRFARSEISDYDAMFLPEPLMTRLDAVKRADGTPLVSETCQMLPAGQDPIRQRPPNRLAGFGALGLLLAGGLVGLGRVSKTAQLVGVGLYASVVTIWGTAALIVGLLGTFAPFWGHDNLAFASPLWALAVAAAIVRARNPEAEWPAYVGAGLLGLAVLGVLGSLVFGFAAGNLGLAAWLVPPTLAVASALGADRFVISAPSPSEAPSSGPAGG